MDSVALLNRRISVHTWAPQQVQGKEWALPLVYSFSSHSLSPFSNWRGMVMGWWAVGIPGQIRRFPSAGSQRREERQVEGPCERPRGLDSGTDCTAQTKEEQKGVPASTGACDANCVTQDMDPATPTSSPHGFAPGQPASSWDTGSVKMSMLGETSLKSLPFLNFCNLWPLIISLNQLLHLNTLK